MLYDVLLKGGMIYNGSGTPGMSGDVAVQGGKIVAVGQVSGTARQTILGRSSTSKIQRSQNSSRRSSNISSPNVR